MFFNEKNEDEDKKNETLRQTLERVMREKGMSKEPQVMHTEIGDFTYYDDNKTDNSGSTDPAGTTPTGLNQPTNLSGTSTASGVSSFNTSDTFNATQSQTPTPWSNSTTSQPTIPYSNGQQLRMPSDSQYQVTMPSNNLQKYNNSAANFVSNTYDSINSAYDDLKRYYFGQRNYQNRYKRGCTPSNIVYNTISNYQISPNQKPIENGNIASNYGMKKVLSKIPVAGKFVNGIINGEKIGNGLTNFYNALDEADCFK